MEEYKGSFDLVNKDRYFDHLMWELLNNQEIKTNKKQASNNIF